jgi:hypothetical protein
MSYEYSAESKSLDLPNPYRIENVFRAITAGAEITVGLALLILSRHQLFSEHHYQGVAVLLLGLAVLIAGIGYLTLTMMQLRFYFGRGKPEGLAPELNPDATGKSPQADALKETIRQNAITYSEPRGPINGLLYGWLRELILSAPPVQMVAQRHFQNALVIAVTLLSWLVAWITATSAQAVSWVGLFYFVFAAFLVLRPLAERGALARADIGLKGLIMLILVAVFGPVLVSLVAKDLPNIGRLSLNGQTALLLLLALAAEAMFFAALRAQMTRPIATNMAREQHAPSMNNHPKQLLDELERELQNDWVERIPNRRYLRIVPQLAGNQGTFAGELLEETQPMPRRDVRPETLAQTFSVPRYLWLLLLDGAGTLLALLGIACYLTFAVAYDGGDLQSVLLLLSVGIALHVIGHFCQRAAHVLWGRFEFTSQVIWFEMAGQFQSAKSAFGNQYADRTHTQREVINTENMTLRVWAAELDTVAFAKDATRYIIGISGRPDLAARYAHSLIDFAGQQSIIVAPTATVDYQKAAVLAAFNHAAGPVGTPIGAALLGQGLPQAAMMPPAAGPPRASAEPVMASCPSCGVAMEPDSAFCGQCGTRLLPAPG